MRLFRKTDRKRIIDVIEKQLKHQPMEETRNRKRLHPNELAEWELRTDKFRVFYDIDENVEFVKIEAVGFKRGSEIIKNQPPERESRGNGLEIESGGCR